MTTGTIVRDGFELEWIREGSGVPMLVLGSARWYQPYYPPALREHFDMVFCDLRQWAATPPGFDLSTITAQTFADDVEAIRTELGLERPIVMGQSQHGWLSQVYADRYPQGPRGVVAIACGPGGDDVGPSMQEFFDADASPARKAAEERNWATRPHFDAPTTSEEFIANYIANDARWWFDEDFDCSSMWEGTWYNVPVAMQMFGAPDGDDFATGAVPTFAAIGRYDYSVPYVWWERPLPETVTVRVYERSGHHAPYEQPDEFVADVVAWAADLD